MAKAKVKRRGNSLWLVFPNEIVKKQGIKAGDELEIEIDKTKHVKVTIWLTSTK